MNRPSILDTLRHDRNEWDIIVIGGGATGLGTALDAASRGYKTLLLEQHDFAKGTSSRSTKLIHGGVRYLRQGNISLVLEALKERGLLLANASHLVKKQKFIIPGYRWWEKPFYGAGMKIYDILSGSMGIGKSGLLSANQTLDEIPTLEPHHLNGGVCYFDGQFDDSRLAVNLMQSVFEQGGTALNYVKVTGFLRKNGTINGVEAEDAETGEKFQLRAGTVINATGVFTDHVRRLDNAENLPVIQVSQGVHIVVSRKFQPGKSALIIPKTDDGRVLFAVPWHDRLIIGTTDTPVDSAVLEPKARQDELDYLLTHISGYLTGKPAESDVKSVFTGLRPLVGRKVQVSTKKLSRDHSIFTDPGGLVTVTGGKWTTYRKMAEETVDHAARNGSLENRPCVTKKLKIHGWTESADTDSLYSIYGSDKKFLLNLEKEQKGWNLPMHPALPYRPAEVIWAVRREMARTVEDVLSRRTRALFLDAESSIKMAEQVAKLIAVERNLDDEWVKSQVSGYRKLAGNYLTSSYKDGLTDSDFG
ncbi:MAG: glycerol-3-phosphate dehydrogenase/oxidase [Balneolaceae bacterium]